MIPIYINNIQLYVKENISILEACSELNINIPRFCYHKNLEIAGNCRMCLVEVKKILKPVASCSMPVSKNMEIFTNSPKILKARESVLEFLLINHPLDCPICDQGGECDLQDQTLIFGTDRSRFFNFKRTVEDKNFGPFIKTIMTRCIHCTRCVRFANEVCNIDNLGTVGRGNKTEISFYINNIFKSEFSGNVVDLCPVGALTSKPFSFKVRPWELKKINIIDILDTSGLNVIVNVFNNKIVRILPNSGWISNKTRYFFDSIKYQRITKPLLKINNQKFVEISWKKAFLILNSKIKENDPSKNIAFIGNLIDLHSLHYIKSILNHLGINNINYLDNKLETNLSNSDIFNNFLYKDIYKNIQNSNLCLLVSLNPKYENSQLNLLLNNSKKRNNMEIFSIGNKLNLPYKVNNLGLSETIVLSILEGKHKLCKKLLKSTNPIIIFGNKTFFLDKYKYFLNFKNINNFFIETGFLNFLEIFSKNNYKKILNSKLIFLFNIHNNFQIKDFKDQFKIVQSHHYSDITRKANLILPTLTFLEKKGLYLNIEGNIKISNKVTQSNNNIKNDKFIIKNLFFYMNKNNCKKFINLYIYKKNKKIYNKKLSFLKNYFKNRYTKLHINKVLPITTTFYSLNILEKTSKILMKSLILKDKNFIN